MAQIRRMPLVIAIAIAILVTLVTIFPGIPTRSLAIQTPSIISANPVTQSVDLGRYFRELGIKGSILIYDQNNKKFYEHNAARNSQAFFPASTFKIFNSLAALETGVLPNEVAVLTWDGIQRQIPAWNQDTNIRQAFKNSTVWFYQVLARRIGRERMQKFINQVGYGNRQIGTPEQIDRFWLEGPLQITPKQQIEFLQRLYRKELPFSQRTFDLVQDIMVFERTPDYVLRGKTGWATSVTPNIGWFVGYLEQNNNAYFFATNIDMRDADDAATRIEITRRSLKALKLL
ncbi:class D beta-lactamase [Nostocaceae cyanobacterium CENA369]|uniref:beta-lactamase n=1 Tax=Dendronalium phyllosphericum CENA369 TaxID=1725256 RepID=A0A8J7IMW5_9NOST|nr:class D beta-lactamase [Dendronalium phyllosphericum]MBH8578391.1 class D beta-lactamase [Dendronalium phyllosphericum CENA369]